jgi:hypothetical protein
MADDGSDSVQQDDQTQDTTTTTATTTEERAFSQADVDRIVQERVARVKAAPPADYADLQAAAKKLADLEAANQTELEKAQTRADEAEKRATQIEAEAKETRLRSSILAEAAKADRKIVDPEAVIALLDRSTLELDDSGVPTNIATAMDSLLEARPYLVVVDGGTRGSADQGARSGGAKQLTKEALKSMAPEEVAQAEKEGRLASLLGVTT